MRAESLVTNIFLGLRAIGYYPRRKIPEPLRKRNVVIDGIVARREGQRGTA